MSPTLTLAQDLISRESITPNDAGCQDVLIQRLQALDFVIEKLPFGEVSNFWAKRGVGPLLVFAGHTDVVPPGPLDAWQSHPFQPSVRDGQLYGRGAADMKGSVAAMITACEQFIHQHSDHQGSIGFLITSDEEGPSVDGTVKVVEHLKKQGEKITWCIVGEASSENQLGDTIKVGRRGSLNGSLTINGKQGHVAYPQKADNPIHKSMRALAELVAETWDAGDEHFPPTSLQISNINAGTGAGNVIPGVLEVKFNFRYNPISSAEGLQARVQAILDRHTHDYKLEWQLSGLPFLTDNAELVGVCQQAIKEITGNMAQASTSGGTSDGRFIAQMGCQVVEVGPINASIHQVDERVNIDDLEKLTQIYQAILVKLIL